MKKIAILHYASPPGVGGVEVTMLHQARGLTKLGYAVRIISGVGGELDPTIETVINPLFGSKHPDVLNVKAELDTGRVSGAFTELVGQIERRLAEALEGCEVLIAHNVLSLNKNLPLTAALEKIHRHGKFKLLAWCHDIAWTSDHYRPELHEGQPYDLLRHQWQNVTYVTVSKPQRVELANLLDIPPHQIAVVPPGVDYPDFFKWTSTTKFLEDELHLLDADGLLLLPARLTRRKNIQFGLRILSEIRDQSSKDYRLIVTGPPGPHNPTNQAYLDDLLNLRRVLKIEQSAHFLYQLGNGDKSLVPDDDTLANLYQLADGLLFPSFQEGFGIPILEAGLVGLPIFCADIPPLRETAGPDALYFDPVQGEPKRIAEEILRVLQGSATARLRRKVRQNYRWDTLIREKIVPLIE
ncbi:MAG: glycosyltransferase family 4 protein [Chloroflexi bacterium]|nr:glycosyltransferase family 4 protein [Chloroflexota bacterium]